MRHLWVLAILLLSFGARAQDAVAVLKAGVGAGLTDAPVTDGTAQAFTFERNLIYFPGVLEGQPANFILDTGAPTLLLNSRGDASQNAAATGLATGGTVALTDQKVESIAIGGRELGKHWALALDLRGMEARTGKTIDGFVGHQLLRQGEVRIDFPGRVFQLLKSVRKPRHADRTPIHTLRFEYVDHLPVVTLRVGRRKLRFAVDTGAGVNLIDSSLRDFGQSSGEQMNIQGLDGTANNYEVVQLSGQDDGALLSSGQQMVVMNLDHLQAPDAPRIDGILGSVCFADYVMGIDYRRQKIYLW